MQTLMNLVGLIISIAMAAASLSSAVSSSSSIGFSLNNPPPRMSIPNPSLSNLRITILGGGNVGSTLAQKLVVSNKFASVQIAARDPAKTIASIQKQKGINDVPVVASTPDSLAASHVVILATPGLYKDEDIKSFASSLGDMKDKVVIDATNPLGPFTDGLQVMTWEGGKSSGEKLQLHLPQSKVYKTFNTIGVEHMKEASGKEMLIAGDPDPSQRAKPRLSSQLWVLHLSLLGLLGIAEILKLWQNCGFIWLFLDLVGEILGATFGFQSAGNLTYNTVL